MNSKQVQLITNFGLTVRFDGKSRAGKNLYTWSCKLKSKCSQFHSFLSVTLFASEIILPSIYEDYVRGLCGNYDGNRGNEYMKPDGEVIRDLNAFGESWRVSGRQSEGLRTMQQHSHSVQR